MRRATLLLGSVFAVLFLFLSCDTDLNQVNPNQLTTEKYYKNAAQLETAVNSVYAALNVTGMHKRRKFFVYDALSGVVQAGGGQTESWIPQMINWNHGDGSNSGQNLHWTALYQGVKRANLVVENAPDVPNISEDLRSRYVGEARFMRGFFYDKLMALWGESGDTNRGIPLFTQAPTQAGAKPIANPSSVDSLIEADLEFAINNLPMSYSSNANVGRATATAAMAIKGRAHLRQGEYQAAHDAFMNVINNGEAPDGSDLRLVDTYFDNFREGTENNDESIFEVQHAQSSGGSAWSVQGGDGTTRTFRNQEYGFLEWRNVVASRSVLEEMGVPNSSFSGSGPQTNAQVTDIDDPRATDTFYFACDTYNEGNSIYATNVNPASNCPNGEGLSVPEEEDSRPSWKKFQVYYRTDSPPSGANSGINFREMRYAEVLLGLAEAKLNGATGSRTVSGLVNQVRSRVGLSGVSNPDMDDLYHEFVMEFTGEPPLFLFLLRNPNYLPQLNPQAPGSGPYYQPIPLEEIDNNPAIGPDVNGDLSY